jgi:SLOG in TRPM, prokaryote
LDKNKTNQAIQKRFIHFLNGHCAWSVVSPIGTDAKDIFDALNIQRPGALIMVAGATSDLSEEVTSHLTQLCSHGIMPAAIQKKAMIIDGGTQVGVIKLIGQSANECGHRSILLGVTCAGLVIYPGGPSIKEELLEKSAPLDPNHSHFVLVESEIWGCETDTMYALARLISKGIPVVTLVINGGIISKNEVLYSIRQGWPLLIIEGTGRLADEIATFYRENPSSIKDEHMREIISKATISLFPLTGSPQDLEQQLLHSLVRNG